MNDLFETIISDLEGESSVTLGWLLEAVGYQPHLVPELQEYMVFEGDHFIQLSLNQEGISELNEVWDGGIVWDEENKVFSYEGADGPGNGTGLTRVLPINPNSVFEIC